MAALLVALAAPAGAHVHGLAQLDIAIEGRHIELSLHGAGDGFVGFEHAPVTAQEQAALEAARARLAELDTLLRIGTDCRSEQIRVMPPEATAHGHDEHAGADWRIEARYVCTQAGSGLKLDAAGLFQSFERLHEIQVQAIGPEQQSGARLSPAVSTFTLP